MIKNDDIQGIIEELFLKRRKKKRLEEKKRRESFVERFDIGIERKKGREKKKKKKNDENGKRCKTNGLW